MNSINNLKKRETSIAWFDFSTLCTTTPYDTKTKVLFKIIFCFKGGNKQIIKVEKHGATWANDEYQGPITLSQSPLKKGYQIYTDE